MSEEFHDVVVVGSGAGGLAAAITARYHGLDVIVVEKEAVFGGTTAWSGGWMWIPGNPVAVRAGVVDDAAATRTYLRHEIGDRAITENVDAFLLNGPRMVDFFERHTSLKFSAGSAVPDFHSKVPGRRRQADRSIAL